MVTANTHNAIEIRGLRRSFGSTKALTDANLIVRSGESRALLGRNGAGKSTLIAMLTGLVPPDGGTIRIQGADGEVSEGPGADTIACVYQKSTLVPELTVAENISLGAYPRTRWGSVDWPAMRKAATDQLKDWGYERIVDRNVEDLEPLEKKIVEVCRALSRGPEILLLDEPTAGLDEGASHELFAQIDSLRKRGVTVIYVSHHLEEIFKVCDSVTILRDGRDVLTADTADLTISRIVNVMAGVTDQEAAAAKKDSVAVNSREDLLGETRLTVTGASVGTRVVDASLTIRAGECVGLTGLDGAGHVQLAQAIAGQITLDRGTVEHNGQSLGRGNVIKTINAGIGFVPEDRHVNGYVPELSVEENATLTIVDRLRGRGGLINPGRRRDRFTELSGAWAIKCDGPTQAVEELSGGNQQKVVLARALASNPDTLVLVHPTAGVDVTAKESIYDSLKALRDSGRSLLVVSSDDTDLEICDRVIVMYKGEIHAELTAGYEEWELVSAIQGAEAAA
ncbi:sugar ABC transporter ATP-binding protein [Paenarthrobacter nitroguajacolicus]|uniref:sugar ABC transporter ATP-binding protein n=1 Tax=Paenarthrobacter nitroguajacolicus TaxID=211146 RepID=UPI003AED5330